ncbi:MAG: response regulator [Anaerolineae bacterium]|nr:response regulator [Anaerolineae bacterium]
MDDATIHPETVRWLLTHIEDSAALAGSPLLERLPALAGAEPYSRAHTIRTLVLDSIESLRPARRLSRRSDEARAYNALWLRYVDGLGVLQVGEELALSERQTHRELRAAEARLAEVLNARLSQEAVPSPASSRTDDSSDDAVAMRPAPVDLQELVEDALSTVAALAETVGVGVVVEPGTPPGTAYADAGVLRQWLIQAISLALQAASGPQVRLAFQSSVAGATVSVVFSADAGTYSREAFAGLERLALTLRAELEMDRGADDLVSLQLTVPAARRRSVLVVEDNPAAVELYRRYLEPLGEWTVVPADDPRQAYELARAIQPAVVLLDLLMPGTDGWTILNLLHASDDTKDIPVIVCSVFHDALLAEALGAKAHLRKPVSQSELLSAVSRWAR